MLEDVEPHEFNERLAASLAKADPLDRVAEILKLGFAALCQSQGAKNVGPDMFEPQMKLLTVHAEQPITGPARPVGNAASPNQAAAMAALALGPPRKR